MRIARFLAPSIIVAAALLAAGATQASGSAMTLPQAATTGTPGTTAGDQQARLLHLVNNARAQAHLGPLFLSSCLDARFANPWAAHMASVRDMYHQDLMPMLSTCDLTLVGENIAYGYTTPDSVFAAWMASPGHRANILDSGYTSIGLGTARATNGTWYWVQDFGRP